MPSRPTHVPSLAAGRDAQPRRSLLLAGGGVHVAYQAGALAALDEAGVRFTHADALSGGTLDLALLLSGLTTGELCEHWRAADVRRIAAHGPARRFVRGDPAVGVDVERVRAAEGIEATFSVHDAETRQYVAVPHDHVDADLLAAGVRRGPPARANAEANLAEALRHDADEVWIVGAGDVPAQEVPARLHVIRPQVPLPLDSDVVLGRIDTATLIAMGYRDAAQHLDAPEHAAARAPVPGVAFREELGGAVGGEPMELRLAWEAGDLAQFLADPRHRGTLVGDVTHPALGSRRLARRGHFEVEDGWVTAQLAFGDRRLDLRRRIRGWQDAEARVVGADGAELGSGRLDRTGPAPWWTLHARGVGSLREGAATAARFWRWVATARR